MDKAFIAQDDVRAFTDCDSSAAQSADDDVVTVSGRDVVVADSSFTRIQYRYSVSVQEQAVDLVEQAAVVLERDRSFVCQDVVRAAVDRNRVAAQTCDDDIGARTGRDRFIAALQEVFRCVQVRARDLCQDRVAAGHSLILVVDKAFIADDEVRAFARRDRPAAQTADHDVVSVSGRDVVVADRHASNIQHRQTVTVEVEALDPISQGAAGLERDLALVSHDDVVAVADRDLVISQATDHDIVTRVGVDTHLDDVVATRYERAVIIQVQARYLVHQRPTVLIQDDARIAEDDVGPIFDRDVVFETATDHNVVALAGEDVVGTARKRSLRAFDPVGIGIGDTEIDEPVIAQNDVVPVSGVDKVTALARRRFDRPSHRLPRPDRSYSRK